MLLNDFLNFLVHQAAIGTPQVLFDCNNDKDVDEN